MDSHFSKAFVPLQPSNVHSERGLLDQQAQLTISSSEPIPLSYEPHYEGFPIFIKLMMSIFSFFLRNCPINRREALFFETPLCTSIRISLLKLISTIIQRRLYISKDSHKYFSELSYSLLFKQYLFPLIITLISENSPFVSVEKLVTFYRSISSEEYLLHVPLQLYYLYGGSVFTIEAKTFKDKLYRVLKALGRSLIGNDTLITRHAEQIQKNSKTQYILDDSVKIVCLAQNKQMLLETVANTTLQVFNHCDYLSKEQFLSVLHRLTNNYVLTAIIRLLRVEYLLVEGKSFKGSLSESEVTKTGFYQVEMQKILSKCPFNGSEDCDCKKCQCVRRNRQSAKLNQEKKRNAIQQVDAMRQQIQELQATNFQLMKERKSMHEENMILKGLLSQIRDLPQLKNELLEALEPISKILHDSYDS